MFPGMGKIDPRKIQSLMKQMGLNQEEIEADRVIIEKSDSSRIIIENPSIQKISMQGQESFQISGEVREESFAIKEEDINLVAEKTNKTKEEAKIALEKTNGDIAEAILSLSE